MRKRKLLTIGSCFLATLFSTRLEGWCAQAHTVTPKFVFHFEQSPGGLMLMEASLNGSASKQFVLDSGTGGPLILDTTTAANLNLKKRAGPKFRFEVLGPVVIESNEMRQAKLKYGKQLIVKGLFPSLSFEKLSKSLHMPIAGLVGAPFFEKFVVTVNYALGELSFYDPHQFHYQGSGFVFNLLDDGGTNLLIIPGKVVLEDGTTLPIRFCIDTGLEYGVTFNSHTLEKYPSIPNKSTVLDNAGIGEAAMDGFQTAIKSLQLGALTINTKEVLVLRREALAELDKVADGNIGASILRQYTIIIDCPHGHIIFEPIRKATSNDSYLESPR